MGENDKSRLHSVNDGLRLAASVILVRPSAHGLELYMTRRSARSAFAPDAFVFPGGALDARDRQDDATARTLGLERERVTREFRANVPNELPNGAAAVGYGEATGLLVAALRELFEEAGILIARTKDGSRVDAGLVFSAGVQDQRERIRDGTLAFADFLGSREWRADARELALFSHWITPPTQSRRFNTHFFFACAPADQAGRADAYETHDGLWIAPTDALALYRASRFHLVYPTVKHLERLASFASVDDALSFARTKPVLTIMPTTTHDHGFALPPALENAW